MQIDSHQVLLCFHSQIVSGENDRDMFSQKILFDGTEAACCFPLPIQHNLTAHSTPQPLQSSPSFSHIAATYLYNGAFQIQPKDSYLSTSIQPQPWKYCQKIFEYGPPTFSSPLLPSGATIFCCLLYAASASRQEIIRGGVWIPPSRTFSLMHSPTCLSWSH